MSVLKYRPNPLLILFGNKRLFWRDGMNLLQEGPLRLISDNCVTLEDVAQCDIADVMRRVKAPWAAKFQ